MTPPIRVPLSLVQGQPFAYTFYWTADVGAVMWSAGVVHALNDMVAPFPALVDDFGNRRFFQCTVPGTSGGTQPAWTTLDYGQTIVDGGVTWTCVPSTQYPISITGATAAMTVSGAPDAVDAELTITNTSGIAIEPSGSGSVSISLTVAQVAQLIEDLSYGFYALTLTLIGGAVVQLLYGPIEFLYMGAQGGISSPTPPAPVPQNQRVSGGGTVQVGGYSLTLCDPGGGAGGGCTINPSQPLADFATVSFADATRSCSVANPIVVNPPSYVAGGMIQNPATYAYQSSPVAFTQEDVAVTYIYDAANNRLKLED